MAFILKFDKDFFRRLHLQRCFCILYTGLLIFLSGCNPWQSNPKSNDPILVSPTQTFAETWKAQFQESNIQDFQEEIRFRRIQQNDGLSNGNITCILQDKTGYLWLGTQNGLNRFDGQTFTIYKPEKDNPDSIGGHWITALANGPDGSIWIGTRENGLNNYIPDTNQFTHYVFEINNPNSISNNSINSLTFDNEENLWIATDDGLDKYNLQTKSFLRFKRNNEASNRIISNQVTAIHFDGADTLWIGTQKNGLDRLDLKKNQFIHFQEENQGKIGFLNNSVNVFAQDEKGYLWIGTASGIFRYNLQEKTFTTFQQSGEDQEIQDNNNTHSILVDKRGEIWFGSEHGLSRFNWQYAKFIDYHAKPGDSQSLSENFILSLFEDSEGNLWIGSQGGGLNQYDRDQNRFNIIANDPQNIESLSSNLVFSLAADPNGRLWIGSYDQGLNLLDTLTGKITRFSNEAYKSESLASNNIIALMLDQEGGLWVGGKSGLDHFDGKNKFTHYVHRARDESSISNNSITSLFQDKTGRIWIGTGNGLNMFNESMGDFISFYNDPEDLNSLSQNRITTINEDQNGNIWVGTPNNGLNRLDPQTGIFTSYKFDPQNSNTVSSNSISVLFKDKKGFLWIGTSGGGLDRYNHATDNFDHIPLLPGSSHDLIYGIEQDQNEHLWISTDTGIFRLNPSNNQTKQFTTSDGLPNEEFNLRSSATDSLGKVYFGTSKGLIQFAPDRLRDSGFQPPVIFTSILVGNTNILNTTDTGNNDLVKIRWPNNGFEFEFTALEFSEPEKNQFAYRLIPLESGWNLTGNNRNGRYTNLAGGNYQLELKATNKDGAWSQKSASINLAVIPPLWNTGWFRILAILLLAGCGIYFYRLRLMSIQRQNLALEQIIQERTQLVHKRNQEIEALYEADTRMYRYLNINQALQALVDVAVEILKADKSCILAWDEKNEVWSIRAQQCFNCDKNNQLKLSADDPIVSQLRSSDIPLVENQMKDTGKEKTSVLYNQLELEKIKSFIIIPIKINSELFAIFIVASQKANTFGEEMKRLFTSLAQRASMSIENALLFEQTKQLAVVEERTRLARDLHDSAKQKAFAALAQIGTVKGTVKGSQKQSIEHLTEAEDLVYEVIQELTFLIQEMYPMTLKEDGLLPALREYVFEWENRNHISTEIKANEGRRLDLTIEQTIYRIIQESLANVARHSQAKQVKITLNYSMDALDASIEDNGVGFKRTDSAKGLGLRLMEERAASIGGMVNISSRKENGTTIRMHIPI